MIRFRHTIAAPLLAALAGLAVPLRARAEEGASLLQAVPPDVHFFAHAKRGKSPDPGAAHAERAWKLLADSRVHRDIIDLCVIDLPEEKRQAIVGKIDRVLDLLGKVNWSLIAHEESVFAFKMGMPLPEYLVLFRVPKSEMDAQLAGMKEMISGFASMLGPIASVRDVQAAGGNVTILGLQGAPFGIAFGAVGDVLVISTSSQLATASMTRLSNGGEGSLEKSERFQATMKSLPGPADAVTFVDIDGLMGAVTQGLAIAQFGMQGAKEEAQIGRDVLHTISLLVGELNKFDQAVTTLASDGTTTTATTLTQMLPSYAGSKLSKLFDGQQGWNKWSKRVPADATSFSFDAGLKPAALYDLLLSCVKEGFQDPKPVLAQWDAMQEEWGVNVRDVLAAFSGETASIEFPSAGAEGCHLGECVVLLRLEKPDVVATAVKHMLESAVAYVRGRGQEIAVESSGGLERIRIDAFPWIRPVIGVRGSELVIATSPAAIEKLDRVAAGKEPDVRSNPRFAALGAGKSDSTRHLSFAEVEVGITPLVDLVAAYGFVFAMFPDDPEVAAMRKLGAILTKVAPALRELDLRYDEAEEILPTSTPEAVTRRRTVRYR
jgi:hypothetical protein